MVFEAAVRPKSRSHREAHALGIVHKSAHRCVPLCPCTQRCLCDPLHFVTEFLFIFLIKVDAPGQGRPWRSIRGLWPEPPLSLTAGASFHGSGQVEPQFSSPGSARSKPSLAHSFSSPSAASGNASQVSETFDLDFGLETHVQHLLLLPGCMVRSDSNPSGGSDAHRRQTARLGNICIVRCI